MNDDNLENCIFYFKREVGTALRTNDKNIVNRIMLPENYPELTKFQKEEIILETSLSFYIGKGIPFVEKFLNYLVFEYQINEEIYTNLSNIKPNKILEHMFEQRKLYEQLHQHLKINDIINKKPKV